MWWFSLLSVFWWPVAGHYVGGWTFAAICGMLAALSLCWGSHIVDLERTGTYATHNTSCDLAVSSYKFCKVSSLLAIRYS